MKIAHYNGFAGADQCGYAFFSMNNEKWLTLIQLPNTKTSITNICEWVYPIIARHERIDLRDYRLAEYYPTELVGDRYVYEFGQVVLDSHYRPFFGPINRQAQVNQVVNSLVNLTPENAAPALPFFDAPARQASLALKVAFRLIPIAGLALIGLYLGTQL